MCFATLGGRELFKSSPKKWSSFAPLNKPALEAQFWHIFTHRNRPDVGEGAKGGNKKRSGTKEASEREPEASFLHPPASAHLLFVCNLVAAGGEGEEGRMDG